MSEVTEKFALSLGEKRTEVWLRLKKHLEETLEKARRKNDDPALTQEQTAALRGEIAAYKKLIALGRED